MRPASHRFARAVSVTALGLFLAGALLPAAQAAATEQNPVRIDAMAIAVNIDHHYALTTVAETLTNPSSQAHEFTANVASSEFSFITRFALEADGNTYESNIENTSAARGAYDATVAASKAAALIETRDTHTYAVSLNLPAGKTVIVHLAYEEMIYRTGAEYRYRFPLVTSSVGKTIGVLTVDGTVTGASPIDSRFVTLGTVDQPTATDLSFSHHSSHLTQPTDFVLTWTEGAAPGAGVLVTHATAEGGSFVHIFSADGAGLGAAPMPKDIVFVIDISGSMQDSLPQVKQVFMSIIGDLKPADRFSVVAFSGGYWEWSADLKDATAENTQSASAWVNDLDAQASTDIDLGLGVGVAKLKMDSTRAPALVLLSDGQPTDGETNEAVIRENLKDRNTAGAAVYTLAFGPDADFPLMQALALENDGAVRRIFEGQDAGAQIRGFYDSIATPLLRGVSVTYTQGVVTAFPTAFPRAFAGSDLTTAGTLAPGATTVSVLITGSGANGPFSVTGTFGVAAAEAGVFVERAWAFERISSLAPGAALGDAAARFEIVTLALQYRFVTDYTSLVVILPASLGGPQGSSSVPLRVTNQAVLSPSSAPTSGAYSATPPTKAAPGPAASAAVGGLAAAALLARRRARKRF